jgi:hypothetical protein
MRPSTSSGEAKWENKGFRFQVSALPLAVKRPIKSKKETTIDP